MATLSRRDSSGWSVRCDGRRYWRWLCGGWLRTRYQSSSGWVWEALLLSGATRAAATPKQPTRCSAASAAAVLRFFLAALSPQRPTTRRYCGFGFVAFLVWIPGSLRLSAAVLGIWFCGGKGWLPLRWWWLRGALELGASLDAAATAMAYRA